MSIDYGAIFLATNARIHSNDHSSQRISRLALGRDFSLPRLVEPLDEESEEESDEELDGPPTTMEQTTPGGSPKASDSIGGSTIPIPPPHLPLRKKASADLRLRTTTANNNSVKDSVASMASRLRPETNRWSGESTSSPISNLDTSPNVSPSPQKSFRLRSRQRPSTAREKTDEDGADTLSPLLRPSTSIPDYSLPRTFQRSYSASTDPLPEKGLSPSLNSPSPKASSTFWRDGGVQVYRESILSSTNGSSAFNTSGSSVFTSRSSQSTRDSSGLDWQRLSDDELSVDDCIEMYANGFRDDPVASASPLRNSTTSLGSARDQDQDTLRRNSSRLKEEDSQQDKRKSDTAKSIASSTIHHDASVPSSSTVTSKSSETLAEFRTGSVMSSNIRKHSKVPRDVYGFKCESQHVSLGRYNAWKKTYKVHLERRKRKWIHLMNSSGLHSSAYPEAFPARSRGVKRYIRKGIPPEWRGAAWFFYGDGASFLEANPGLYDRLVEQAQAGAVTPHDRDHIERDLHRTFPDNIYFKPDEASGSVGGANELETEMIKSLRRLLEAYALYRPKVGYCQSLNFLAGHLLLFMRISFLQKNFEERAFALLCILTEKYLPGTHGVVLEGANVDIGVLMTILQETMPSLWAKLDDNSNASMAHGQRRPSVPASVTLKTNTDRLPTVSLATTAWFMSCFVSTLPIESACRVWDCLWYEGSKTIFRVALAIFKLGEKQIKKASDPMEVFQIVQNLPKGLLDANELLEVATMKTGRGIGPRLGVGTPGFGGLSQKTVESRRDERRAHGKAVRERAQSGADAKSADGSPVIPPPPIPDEPVPSLKRRSTLKRLKSLRKIA